MGSVPTGRVEVVNVAVLLKPLPGVRVAVPMAVAPSMKTTGPVGAAKLPESVAVKVTGWPTLAGFNEDMTAAVEAGRATAWLSTAEVAAPKFCVAA